MQVFPKKVLKQVQDDLATDGDICYVIFLDTVFHNTSDTLLK